MTDILKRDCGLDTMQSLEQSIKESIAVKQRMLENKALIQQVALVTEVIVTAYKNGKKLLVAGNGGSAADAQHMAAELVSRFYFDRPALPAIALTVDTSAITAIGNDYGFDRVFLRQLEAHGQAGDVYFTISTSGNSVNLVESLKICRDRGIITVGLTGSNPCKMDDLCDYMLKVDSNITPRIQETQLLIEHMICGLIEEQLFPEYKNRC